MLIDWLIWEQCVLPIKSNHDNDNVHQSKESNPMRSQCLIQPSDLMMFIDWLVDYLIDLRFDDGY